MSAPPFNSTNHALLWLKRHQFLESFDHGKKCYMPSDAPPWGRIYDGHASANDARHFISLRCKVEYARDNYDGYVLHHPFPK